MSRPRRGELWWTDLEPARGQEINKTRPVVVISEDEIGALAVKTVVPLTTMTPSKVGQPWLVPVAMTSGNGLRNDSAADALQVRAVAVGRFKERLGVLSADDLDEVVAAVAVSIGAS